MIQADINTKFITLVGLPLGQSFAARMQNAAYEAAGINMGYFYTEADSEHLKEIINGVHYMPSFAGAAITKPNKVKVIEYLDEIDPLCAKMGACNTIVKLPDGKLKGYNTDGSGFLISIREEAGVDIENTVFFCYGAGGAGRAMCSILAYNGAKKIYITDKFPEFGKALVDDINRNFAPVAEFVEFEDNSKLSECGVVMNASGIGMGSTQGMSPMPVEYIRKDTLYFDACYNPDKTQFLMNAEAAGCRILNGLGMSLFQGVVQIELWTGKPAPVEVMRNELKNILAEKSWTGAHDSKVFK